MTPEPVLSHKKNCDIEVLRAFAILYVLALHLIILLPADSSLLIPLSYLELSVGVDLFLVISGFVITGSLLESTRDREATKRPLMFAFWIKRIFRLLPAAWTWVAIAGIAQLLIIGMTDSPYRLQDVLISTAAALGNLMNIYVPYCLANDVSQACLTDNFLGHYWSLSLEEQFYIVFPFLFFFLKRRTLVALLMAAILAQSMWHRPFFTYAWFFKTDALCWGILLALFSRTDFYRRHLPFLFRVRYLASISGLALLLCLPLVGAHTQGMWGDMKAYGVALVASISAAIVWLASYDRNAFSIGRQYRKAMLYLGSRSYSLYLSHLVAYMSVQTMFKEFGQAHAAALGPAWVDVILIALAGALTLLGAELTYRGIETRLRERGRRVAARLVANSHV